MGKKAYIGVNNVPKNVTKIYVGVNGVARKVIKGYVGVNGVARIFWDGGGESNVLWNYTIDNNNSILYGGNTFNAVLHSSVENYTQIIMEINPYISDTSDNFIVIPVKLLPQLYIPNRINIGLNLGIWRDRIATYDIEGTSLKKVRDSYGRYNNSMGLVKVWGNNPAYTITKLWDYVIDNGGVIPYNPVTLTLHSAIENYDEIFIELISIASDITAQYGSLPFIISVNALEHAYRPHYFNHTSWSNRSSAYYMEGTTLTKILNNVANTNGIVKVWGIKY